MKIFLISPVARATPELNKKIAAYVRKLEKKGHTVHWPIRDTKQTDETGGYLICLTNFTAMMDADEVHVWYDETSGGSKFDLGGLFMLREIEGVYKKVVIANRKNVRDVEGKSFYKVLLHLAHGFNFKR